MEPAIFIEIFILPGHSPTKCAIPSKIANPHPRQANPGYQHGSEAYKPLPLLPLIIKKGGLDGVASVQIRHNPDMMQPLGAMNQRTGKATMPRQYFPTKSNINQ